MYSEKSFKNYIFWTKVRRIFIILLLTIIGCLLGIFISDLINTIAVNDAYRVIIVTISTLLFFAISLLLTIGTAREIQDGYWKMAVLRKLTVMSKKLDKLGNLENIKEDLSSLENLSIDSVDDSEDIIETQDNDNLKSIPQTIPEENVPEPVSQHVWVDDIDIETTNVPKDLENFAVDEKDDNLVELSNSTENDSDLDNPFPKLNLSEDDVPETTTALTVTKTKKITKTKKKATSTTKKKTTVKKTQAS